MYVLNGKKISIDADLTVGEGDTAITVPALSLRDPAMRASLGIEEVPDAPRPDESLYFIVEHPDGTYTTAPKSVDQVAEAAQARAKVEFARYVAAPIEWSPDAGVTVYVVDADEMSAFKAAGAKQMMDVSAATERAWTLADNTRVTFPADQFTSLALAIGAKVDSCYAAKAAHCAAIGATVADPALTADQQRAALAAYDCSTGWPVVWVSPGGGA